jgi:predicted transcriptional regulator
MSTISIEIDDKTTSDLNSIAALSHQKFEDVIKTAISRYVASEQEKIEDEHRYQNCLDNGGIENARVIDWLERCNAGEDAPCPK